MFEKGPDEIGALRKYIDGMLEKCSKILSVAGRVHIQYPESNHALMALGRPKDNMSIMTYGCFIGDIIGFFEIVNKNPADGPSGKLIILLKWKQL